MIDLFRRFLINLGGATAGFAFLAVAGAVAFVMIAAAITYPEIAAAFVTGSAAGAWVAVAYVRRKHSSRSFHERFSRFLPHHA